MPNLRAFDDCERERDRDRDQYNSNDCGENRGKLCFINKLTVRIICFPADHNQIIGLEDF